MDNISRMDNTSSAARLEAPMTPSIDNFLGNCEIVEDGEKAFI